MTLFFDVLLDDFVGDVATRNAKVSARPHVATPELLSQMWKLMHQLVRTLPLEHLEQPTDGHSRWHTDEQMNVIAGDMPFHDRHFRSAADFADQLSEPCANFTTHDWLTIFRDPDDVQMNAKDCMRAMSVFCHEAQFNMWLKPAKAFA